MSTDITPEQMRDLIVGGVRSAAGSVFSTMLGTTAEFVEAAQIALPLGESESVLALIGLAGPWIGTGAVMCPPSTACKIAAGLFMSEYDQVNEEVLDSVAEIANMIIGNLKTVVEERVGPMGLSTPTIIYGRSFTTRISGQREWTLIRFNVLGGDFIVQAGLHKNLDVSTRPMVEFVGHLMARS